MSTQNLKMPISYLNKSTKPIEEMQNQKDISLKNNARLAPGFYVPTVAIFKPITEQIDVEATKRHVIRLAKAGVTGLVTHGSNGEAVHLTHVERTLINQITRESLNSIGRSDMPLISGCGAQSTQETIQLCKEASRSGCQFALLLPPSYYGKLVTTSLTLQHFRDVADASPIPILIYNYPAACGGLDLDSDAVVALSKHQNIVGVKLTCGNTGKLARVVADAEPNFRVFGGSADFLLQTMAVGGDGIIGGLGNIAPKACIKLMQMQADGMVPEGQRLQQIIAKGDWVAIKGGFISLKIALETYFGYGGPPRKPCAIPSKEYATEVVLGFEALMEFEKSL